MVTSMLRDVVRRGTATAARRFPQPVAGKTGTTNDNTDAWFVGFTARAVAAVWVGYDDPSKTMGRRDDGSHAALPIWLEVMGEAEGDRRPVPLPGEPPDGMVRARVDRETGLLARPGAGGAVELVFRAGTEPTQQVGAPKGVPTDLGRVSREF
jgi:penicillin-binding protein 1A